MQCQDTFSTLQLKKINTLKWIQNVGFALGPALRARSFGGPFELADVGACGQNGLGAPLDRRVFECASILPFALRPEAADCLRGGGRL